MNLTIQALEIALIEKQTSHLPEDYIFLFNDFHSQNYVDFIVRAEKLFKHENQIQARAFILHLICAACDLNYDIPSRNLWMCQWNIFVVQDESGFSQIAQAYHKATTCYFEAYNLEALNRFKSIVDSSDQYPRFKALSYYHLGLIHLSQRHYLAAKNFMKMALEVALIINHKNLIIRIEKQLHLISQQLTYNHLDQALCLEIKNGNMKSARRLYLNKRKQERQHRIHRQRTSLFAVLPAYYAKKAKLKKAIEIIAKIEDPVLKMQAIEFVNSLGYLKKELEKIYNLLCQELGTHQLIIENIEIQRLIELFKEKKQVTKEDICHKIWNIDFVPTIHDGKVYKLIMKARNYIGIKDAIINSYGYYQLNEKYKAKIA